MYIKQVIIEGFRSYKEQVATEVFSPKHNCVVGANGSGKSNFFHAIRFVLSDMSNNLRAEDRQAILHEGAGHQVMSAFVEIVFDNSDNRLPVDRDEVRLRRTIGLKKDEYFLDKKHITKAEVSNLLESAGFSRSNPYYVVQQGKITSLTTMKDTERLALLKEIGGTNVYEERRKESLKIMEDSKNRRNQILEVVAYIEERLKELDEEKEELQKYQQLDKERRTLEYTIFDKELADAKEKLEQVEAERANAVKKSSSIHNKVEETREQLKEKEKELKALSKQLDALSKEKAVVEGQKEEAIQTGAKAEIDVREAKARIDSEKEEKVSIENELKGLGTAVDKAKKELLKVEPLHEEWKQKEEETNKGIAERERRLAILYQKQGRSTQFASKAERDKALQKEITDLQKTIEQRKKQMNKLEKEVAALQKLVFDQSDGAGPSSSTIAEREAEIKKVNADHAKLHEERNGLQNQRKELWRRDNEIASELDKLKHDVESSSRRLDSSTARDINRGITNVKRIVQEHRIQGVHGTLLENIECDDKFNTAVEVAAGNSLFHVIVDNEEIATEIVARLNREKGGRVTFMPLNLLRSHDVHYPNSPDVVPILHKITFKPMFKNAFAQVFSKTVICRDLDVGNNTARNHNLDCVTLDGDQVNKKGAMTGGYHDSRSSRLKLIKAIKTGMQKQQELMEELKTVKASIQSVDQKITVIMGEMQKMEAQRSFVKDRLEQARQDLRAASQLDQSNKIALDKKEKALTSIRDAVAQLEQNAAALESEIGSDLLGQLSREETAELQSLNPEVTDLKQQLVEIRKKRMEYEAKRSELESILTTNLGKRQEELQASLAAINTESRTEELAAKMRDLEAVQATIKDVSQRQADISSKVAAVSLQVRQLKGSHEDLRSQLEEDERVIQDEGKELEALRNKRNLYQTQRENLNKKIRDLGSLPQEAYQQKYVNTSMKRLHKLLKEKNEELKKLSHVNKKALDQYVNFTEQREELRRRQDELDKGDEKIRDLIDVLDARKDEAIELTFKGVAKNFKEAFAELVPGGSASLVMQKKRRKTDEADAEEAEGEGDEDGQTTNTAEKYVGVRVKVSFSGHGETQSMKQLSGGQKTVVALALIFAIQRCDPAPFYLFDEIDAALDPQYRTAVGEMVRKQTEADPPTQFITTTFRPELVKVADRVYGVSHKNRVSMVNVINQEKALQFIEQDLVAQHA